MLTLYAQRAIVEKHSRYALYHPSAEAVASMLMDLPYKVLNAITFNIVLYFMTNLRREPAPFFFYVFTSFIMTLTMSMYFRFVASAARSLVQALVPSAIITVGLVMYTAFTLPANSVLGWARWIPYINPISYGFESLMVNEFKGRDFACANYVTLGSGYEDAEPHNRVCAAAGAVPGQAYARGENYIASSYGSEESQKWVNIGIIFAFMLGFMLCYLVASEFVTEKASQGEILIFPRGHQTSRTPEADPHPESDIEDVVDVEKAEPDPVALIKRQTAIFQWEAVCCDLKVGGKRLRVLDRVDGWAKPGTMTALMGVSGAGKTTLLDVLAARTTVGVVGDMLVDGEPRDGSFQRRTGYAQQQDLHLSTSTVREALTFSALLRQPSHVPHQEKIDYVTEVIRLLDMTDYANAAVGIPGKDGLNVEQRKRLTIGVELAARPALLLFLDEPTSGLDAQTSWIIIDLLDKLRRNGQAILCTLHQPSAMLFQRFDRLLLLKSGGQTVYYRDIGPDSEVLIDYFVRNGAEPTCPPDANPAEWMLEVIGAAPASHTDIDWHATWRASPEHAGVKRHLAELKCAAPATATGQLDDESSRGEFAAPFATQFREMQARVLRQVWRTPAYVYSKLALCAGAALFVGFSLFKASNSLQGLMNQMFAVFMLLTLFGQLVQQTMPLFTSQRALYEARERPSKTYSWKAFMLSNILVELPWNTLMSILVFLCFYYPVGLYRNAEAIGGTDVWLRPMQIWLFIWTYLVFASTFSRMLIAGVETVEDAGNIGNLLFVLCLMFCGIMVAPDQLPSFWKFMYRASPFTYLTGGMLAIAVSDSEVVCDLSELLRFRPPPNMTCGDYMASYQAIAGGYVLDTASLPECRFCPLNSTNLFLETVWIRYKDVWLNLGILWAFIAVNVIFACGLYWLVRVPKRLGGKRCSEKPLRSCPEHGCGW